MLRWHLTHSSTDIEALRNREDRDAKPSEELASKPTIPFSLEWIWKAFWLLSSSRGGSGFGPLPILLTELEAYSRIEEIDSEGLRLLVYHVYRMDSAWLSHVMKKTEDKEEGEEDGNET